MRNLLKPSSVCLLLINLILPIHSCKKDKSDTTPNDGILIPVLTTDEANSITTSSASSGGNITSDGGGAISARGICWAILANPTIAGNKTSEGTGAGVFTSSINSLTPKTIYYVRAYATNSKGTGYGAEVQFTTLVDYTGQTGTVSDIDGNTYPTIGIGSQIWMAANLKSTKYRNGTLIGTTTPATLDITAENSPKYQWAYAGNENNVSTYGRLYTWHAVTDGRLICPTGWHVPTVSELLTLTTFAGGTGTAGAKLKETGTMHWTTPNTGATNMTGFTALPGGVREAVGTFKFINENGGFWSSTENRLISETSWFLFLFYDSGISSLGYFNKSYGYSVRCLKD